MLRWLFGRPQTAYRLPCGRYADPLATYRSLAAGHVNSLLDQREDHDPVQWHDAETRLCSLVRSAFGVPAFDPVTGTGYSDEDCLVLYEHFARWCDQEKGWGRSSLMNVPTTAAPTDPSPAPNDCGCS